MRFSDLIAPAVLLAAFSTLAAAQDVSSKTLSTADHAESNQPVTAELAEYRTVDTAITTKTDRATTTRLSQPGYLGVILESEPGGRLLVSAVAEDSPGARAGIVAGDAIVAIGNQPVHSADRMREYLMSRSAGDELKLVISRADCTVPIATKLAAVSRPMQLSTQRAVLGIRLGEMKDKPADLSIAIRLDSHDPLPLRTPRLCEEPP